MRIPLMITFVIMFMLTSCAGSGSDKRGDISSGGVSDVPRLTEQKESAGASSDSVGQEDENLQKSESVTAYTTVGEVLAIPAFENFGRLLFPVDRTVSDDMTLEEVSTSSVYVWYTNIKSEKTVEIINSLKDSVFFIPSILRRTLLQIRLRLIPDFFSSKAAPEQNLQL